jgi:hypothetical protein
MAEDFESRGLDTAFITSIVPWYGNADNAAAALPWAKPYDSLGYPPCPVRLLVAPLAGAPRLASVAAQIAGSFLRLLPEGTKVRGRAARALLSSIVAVLYRFAQSTSTAN